MGKQLEMQLHFGAITAEINYGQPTPSANAKECTCLAKKQYEVLH